jgi:hypothetical protein
MKLPAPYACDVKGLTLNALCMLVEEVVCRSEVEVEVEVVCIFICLHDQLSVARSGSPISVLAGVDAMASCLTISKSGILVNWSMPALP